MDGNIVFNKTVMIIRGKDNEFFWATTKLKLTKTSTLDLEKLDKIAINLDAIRPLYSARLLRAPTPVPQDSYIKEPSLIDYKENLTEESIITKLILHEIEAPAGKYGQPPGAHLGHGPSALAAIPLLAST
ncbi:hypothetical protein E4U12_007243 [Claviceps purpurea]|nr:hypothetical protein E4U12_007243 [Claviceps purpurea]